MGNTTNLDKMKEKLNAYNNRGKKVSDTYWKPEEGPGIENTIRIVPLPGGDPFPEFHLHWDVLTDEEGKLLKGGVMCRKRHFNENCPFCEYGFHLHAEGNTDEAKKFWPKARYRSVVLVRGEEEQGLRVWSFPPSVYGDFLNWVTNPRYGDITDELEGTDVILRYFREGGKTWPTYKMELERKDTPLLSDSKGKPDKEAIETLLSDIPDYTYREYSSEEVETLFERLMVVRHGDEVMPENSDDDKPVSGDSDLSAKVGDAIKELG